MLRLDPMEAARVRREAPSNEEIDGVAARAAVLGEPTRLLLAAIIRSAGEVCVHDLHQLAGMEQSVTSHHLGRLRQVGLVAARRDGKQTLYSLRRAGEELLQAMLPAPDNNGGTEHAAWGKGRDTATPSTGDSLWGRARSSAGERDPSALRNTPLVKRPGLRAAS